MTPADVFAVTPLLDVAFDRMIAASSRSFCGMCRDTQDERRIQIERQLEGVVDRSLDAMVFFDPSRTVRAWNPGAERLFGWPASEMVGASLDRILPDDLDTPREVEEAIRTLRERGHVRLPETRRRCANGEIVWVDVSYTAVRDRSESLSGIWAVFRDISERKRLEEENLQAERLALIGTMSAKLAHEVRNPLNSLVLGLDLIRDNLRTFDRTGGGSVHETEDLVSSIESEMRRIRNVVEHYLQFARLPTLSMKPVDLGASLRWHLELMAPELESRRIRLVFDDGTQGDEVRVDEAQLWQAILNLVRNSIDSMPEGGVLMVETRAVEDRLEIDVRDTGCGMTEEVRSRIFHPFFSTKRAGTGLGMPLAQQIVHEHGGTIACTSTQGKGTRFTIRLPLRAGERHPAENA
jgi:PAS domain S-box-containing protein